MKRILLPLASLLCILCGVSCEDETSSPITIIIPIEQYNISANSGDKAIFDISIKSNNGTLSTLKITERSATDGIVTLCEESLNTSSYKIEYIYDVPEIAGIKEERSLAITASNANGDSLSQTINVTINSATILLTEKSSLTMCSATTDAQCGYSFVKDMMISTDGTTDDSYIDIYDASTDDTLSLEWRSKTGLYFARNTGFNYSEATATTIKNSYNGATKLDKITNLTKDDIIFIGVDSETPVAAIKIIHIADGEGRNDDCYTISMKLLDYDWESATTTTGVD